ncbi:MAG: VWA domain-containing protein [Prevotellaceae bacterium]|jgi:Ca-activated chloride channel family protein|nr:VWA domain-containing protein [Prevotellaceae bacterium]
MFRFAQLEYLLLLLIIPALIIIYVFWTMRKRQLLSKIGNINLLSQLMPDASPRRGWFKMTLVCFAIFCIAVALARPQTGAKVKKEETGRGTEVMLILDVSNSMLAQDFKPTRLERAKFAISHLVDRLKNDRIGLIVFAGDAFVQLPITSDYISAKIFLKSINPGIVPVQGTNMAKAIHLALNSFSENSQKSRSIIIISDGEDHDEDAINAASEAADQNVRIHTVGIGSAKGAPILLPDGSFLKDKSGSMVITRLNEAILKTLSQKTKGIYFAATNADIGLTEIIENINEMDKKEITKITYDEYREWFVYFLLLSLVFIIGGIFVLERKNKWLNSIDIFRRKKLKKQKQ